MVVKQHHPIRIQSRDMVRTHGSEEARPFVALVEGMPGTFIVRDRDEPSGFAVLHIEDVESITRPAPLVIEMRLEDAAEHGYAMGLGDIKAAPAEADPEPHALKWVGSAVAHGYQMSTCGRFIVCSGVCSRKYYPIDIFVKATTGTIVRSGPNGTLEEAVKWCQDRKRYDVITKLDGTQHLEECDIPF